MPGRATEAPPLNIFAHCKLATPPRGQLERFLDMRLLRPALAALAIVASGQAAFLTPALAQECVCPSSDEGALRASVAPSAVGRSRSVIYADEAPPPLPDYDQPPMPEPGYYWTPGYWAWNNVDYYWVPGAWVPPPEPGLLWTPGYWVFAGGVYAFHAGYWAHQVGFYGGVNYGFGYFGHGYDGGRWDGDRLFYNTAVNNIGPTQVTTVYNNPVVVNNVTNVTNVSYSGGPGGVVAAPTAQEKRVAAEARIPPTPMQREQVKAASIRPEQFVSTNQGKPAIAATPRPADFKAAVPAKAPGGPIGPNGRPLPANAAKGEMRPPPGVIPRLGGPPGAHPAIIAPGQQPNLKPGEKPLVAPPPAAQQNAPQPPGALTPEKGPGAAPGQPPAAGGGAAKELQRQQLLQKQQEQDRAKALQQQQNQQLLKQQEQDRAKTLQQQQNQQLLKQQEQDRAKALQQQQNQQLLKQQEQDRAKSLQQQEQQRQLQLQRQQEQERARAGQQQEMERTHAVQQQQQMQQRALQQQQMQQRALQQQQQMRQQMQGQPPGQGHPERQPRPGEKMCGQPGLPPCPH